jgi:hypothetical protein
MKEMGLQCSITGPSLAHLQALGPLRVNCRQACGDPPAGKTKDLAIVYIFEIVVNWVEEQQDARVTNIVDAGL